jgi:hypothetical protein
MMRKWNHLAMATLLLPLISVNPVLGQSRSEPVSRAAMVQQGQDGLIEMFLDHATAELNLTEEQRSGLEVALRETMDRRGELARRQAQVAREIREALSDPATQDDEFRRLSGEIISAKRREVELAEWQDSRLLEVLTPRQTLRFMLMQQQLAQRIEEIRRQRSGEGRQRR